MISDFWKRIIDEQMPDENYSVGLAEEFAQSGGFTVRQLEKYLEERENARNNSR